MNTLSGADSLLPNPPHPLLTKALTPANSTALKMSLVNWSGSSTTIEPNPMYMGASPASRNFTKSSGGLKEDARSRNTNPDRSISGPQSFGFGTKPGLHYETLDLVKVLMVKYVPYKCREPSGGTTGLAPTTSIPLRDTDS